MWLMGGAFTAHVVADTHLSCWLALTAFKGMEASQIMILIVIALLPYSAELSISVTYTKLAIV